MHKFETKENGEKKIAEAKVYLTFSIPKYNISIWINVIYFLDIKSAKAKIYLISSVKYH